MIPSKAIVPCTHITVSLDHISARTRASLWEVAQRHVDEDPGRLFGLRGYTGTGFLWYVHSWQDFMPYIGEYGFAPELQQLFGYMAGYTSPKQNIFIQLHEDGVVIPELRLFPREEE